VHYRNDGRFLRDGISDALRRHDARLIDRQQGGFPATTREGFQRVQHGLVLDGAGDQMTSAGGLERLGGAADREVVGFGPPLVKTISDGSPWMRAATADRASSMAAFACCRGDEH
jgi:hypothetical protein